MSIARWFNSKSKSMSAYDVYLLAPATDQGTQLNMVLITSWRQGVSWSTRPRLTGRPPVESLIGTTSCFWFSSPPPLCSYPHQWASSWTGKLSAVRRLLTGMIRNWWVVNWLAFHFGIQGQGRGGGGYSWIISKLTEGWYACLCVFSIILRLISWNIYISFLFSLHSFLKKKHEKLLNWCRRQGSDVEKIKLFLLGFHNLNLSKQRFNTKEVS